MKKLTLGLGILFLLVIVLPVAAAPAVQKVTGGGGYIYSEDGSFTAKSFTAQVDAQGNVKGKWVVNSYVKRISSVPMSPVWRSSVTGLSSGE